MGRILKLLVFFSAAKLFANARPLKSPDFVSQWFYLTSSPGRERIDVNHRFGEIPALVQVQVRSVTENNFDYIFPAVGLVPRDDDMASPRAGVVYLYDEERVSVSGLSENNHFRGRTIYTENSNYWKGPNSDEAYDCYVRVRAWKMSSFPQPDYHLKGLEIKAACQNEPGCFHELQHTLREYPSLVVVRTKLKGQSEFSGFMSDAVGAGLMVYENFEYILNGYVTFGFNDDNFRIWTDSSVKGIIFNGNDGTGFGATFHSGELEILAWRTSTLTPTSEEAIQLGSFPGEEYDQDKRINILSETQNIMINVWAEATSGPNSGYRFSGSGSLAYSSTQTTSPCSYGGLTYAYTNTSIRTWKPGPTNIGSIICIPHIFGGMYAQGSNEARAKANIWVPQESTLHWPCSTNDECFDSNSACANATCQCVEGYYDASGLCEKILTCADQVPPIPGLAKRARNYVTDPSSGTDKFVDDSGLKLSWYQASTSRGIYQIPSFSFCRMENSCGSKIQVCLNGSHPDVNDINESPEVLLACYDDCTETVHILVRKCKDGSLHYQLQPLPVKDMAYCFDPPELFGIEEFDPAPVVKDVHLNVSVELHFSQNEVNTASGIETSYNPYLTFNCTSDIDMPKELFYTTYWFFGSQLFLALGPSNSIESLTEEMLTDRKQGLGIYMSCGVRMSSTVTGLMTSLRISSEQFYGIKVHNPNVVLKKGENAYVTIEPTAPIGCRYSDSFKGNCTHFFYMVIPEVEGCDLSSIIDVQRVKRCGSELKAYKVNESWTEGDLYHYEITTKDENFADGHQFRLPLQLSEYDHNIWKNYRIDNVMVYVTHSNDYKYKQCYSHVDPHMQTADGYRYENQYEGEFVLYRNVKYGIEVQEKTTPCNGGRAYCACAVAVRAGGDVFLINMCGGLKFIGFTSCSDGGILDVRKRTSLRYQVFTPVGTYINIQLRPHPGYFNLMNIDVFMAPKDLAYTEGLCGFFDNMISNDLRKRNKEQIPTQNNRRNYHPDFSQDWRLKPFEQNFFRLSPGKVNTWQTEQRDMFCYCNKSLIENSGANSNMEATAVCSSSIYSGCTESKRSVTGKLLELCNALFKRKRRSLSAITVIKELKRRQGLVEKEIESVKKMKNGSNGMVSENEAIKHCTSVINSEKTVTDFSHRLKSIDPKQIINECAFDVSEGNDPSWANVYPSVLNQVIEANNERDPVYVTANKDEVARFNSQSCPFDCNGKGNCSNEGDCHCIPGYHGPDCSIDENDPLEIEDIEGDGLCDIGFGEECRCFHIQTTNLLENFYCLISETLIMINGSKTESNITDHAGSYIDIFSGECCLPSLRTRESKIEDDIFARQYDFAISNNGKSYGTAARAYIYDSTCQQQMNSPDGIYFILKENTCFIFGTCLISNETNTDDECNVCLPNNETFAWTNICDTSKLGTGHRKSVGYILGICIVALITFLIVVAYLVWRHFHRTKTLSVTDSVIYSTEPPAVMNSKYRPPDLKTLEC